MFPLFRARISWWVLGDSIDAFLKFLQVSAFSLCIGQQGSIVPSRDPHPSKSTLPKHWSIEVAATLPFVAKSNWVVVSFTQRHSRFLGMPCKRDSSQDQSWFLQVSLYFFCLWPLGQVNEGKAAHASGAPLPYVWSTSLACIPVAVPKSGCWTSLRPCLFSQVLYSASTSHP